VSRFATGTCCNAPSIQIDKGAENMQISHHAGQRMSQRGISRRLVEFTLRHGRIDGDKHVLDRDASRRLIDELNEELRLAKRVLDKGGVTVVEGDATVITTYSLRSPLRRLRSGGSSHG
jgi:hypothetical protein